MSDQEINVAIAEACGYKFDEAAHQRNATGDYSTNLWEWRRPDGYGCEHIPDYANDLNAMHEAEMVMEPKNFSDPNYLGIYEAALKHLANGNFGFELRATAHQRAVALLKTINKWKP